MKEIIIHPRGIGKNTKMIHEQQKTIAKLEAEDIKNLKMIQKLKDENKILWRIIKEFKETYTDNADEIEALETGGCISLK